MVQNRKSIFLGGIIMLLFMFPILIFGVNAYIEFSETINIAFALPDFVPINFTLQNWEFLEIFIYVGLFFSGLFIIRKNKKWKTVALVLVPFILIFNTFRIVEHLSNKNNLLIIVELIYIVILFIIIYFLYQQRRRIN